MSDRFTRPTLLAALATAALAAALLAPAARAGAQYTVQTVQFPGDPGFTQLLGINNAGTIAGFHGATTAAGFTLTLPSTFATENFPNAAQTMVTAINSAGSTAGIYMDAAGTTHGFTRIAGVFHTVDDPNHLTFNQALGINDANVTVGYSAVDQAGQTGQLAYRQSGGVFTNINALLPTNLNSQAVGLNTAGDIVGFFVPATGGIASVGFLDVGGVISTLDPFGSTNTQALGINNRGEIVGFYTDAGGVQHGYTDMNGVFASFDPTGSVSTTINGVNDLGQLVGFYTDANANVVGFVATTTPEPATLGLLGLGLAGVAAAARRRRTGTAVA